MASSLFCIIIYKQSGELQNYSKQVEGVYWVEACAGIGLYNCIQYVYGAY